MIFRLELLIKQITQHTHKQRYLNLNLIIKRKKTYINKRNLS